MRRRLTRQSNWLPLLLTTVLFGWLFMTPPIPIRLIAQEDAKAKQEDDQEETDEDYDPAVQMESFDFVWSTIKRMHWDKDLVGEPWDKAREEFRPQIEEAKSIDDVRRIIGELLETLDQSHFGVIPNDAYEEIEDDGDIGGSGTTGIEVRYVEDRLVVTRVFEGMPGEKAGIQPGWEVKMLGKRTSDAILRRTKLKAEHSVMRIDTAVGLICDALTTGDVGDKMPMVFIDHDDEVVLKHVDVVEAPGKYEKFGNLPETLVHFESKKLDDEVGYIAFNSFIGGPRLIREYKQALIDYHDAKGLIIDLRGNRGGLVILVSGMCNFFATDKAPIGTMTQSGGTVIKLASNPRKLRVNESLRKRFDRPVAVLTDSCSISAAEIMAGGIKDLKLGRVFGSTTAGLSLPSTVVKLPNGDGFQFAIASYVSASGESIEGVGVVPNQPVKLTRELLSKQDDPVLAAAKKWIIEQ